MEGKKERRDDIKIGNKAREDVIMCKNERKSRVSHAAAKSRQRDTVIIHFHSVSPLVLRCYSFWMFLSNTLSSSATIAAADMNGSIGARSAISDLRDGRFSFSLYLYTVYIYILRLSDFFFLFSHRDVLRCFGTDGDAVNAAAGLRALCTYIHIPTHPLA